MFEYWIYNEDVSKILFTVKEEVYLEYEGYFEFHGDYVWYFQARNLLVLQSHYPFGDGNSLLDEILLKLAKNYQIHDMGIKKSHWRTSSFF